MKVKVLAVILIVLGVFGCGKSRQDEHYTTVLEGIKTAVSVQSGGKLIRLLVSEGVELARGDTIAIFDSQQLGFQLEQLNAGFGEIDVQESVYRTQIAQLETDAEYLSERIERTRNLYQASVIPKQNLDDILNSETKLKSQISAANQNLGVLKAKRAQLDAQKKALLEREQDMVVLANSSGVVETSFYREGEIVPPLGQIVEIMDTRSLTARIYVSEAELPGIKLNDKVWLQVSGAPGRKEARVTRIAGKAEFTPKTILTPDNRSCMVYAVQISCLNTKGDLKDGMPVDVYLK